MPKCYSYLRFSTPEQALGDSRRRQTKLAEDYAAAHKLTLDTELHLHDLGVSAFRGDNVAVGALGAFLKAVQDGTVEAGSFLLVESLDRVSRMAARKAVRVLEDIVEAGVTVVTLNDNKAYTAESLDGMDFIWAVMVLIRANEESVTKSRRLRAAWHGKRQRIKDGHALTSRTPGWIKLDAERRPQLIPERAKVVQRIIHDALRGVPKDVIVKNLNAERVPTFGRAKHWGRSYVLKLLAMPALTGTFTPHVESYVDGKLVRTPQEPVQGYFPALIDADTFERLQATGKRSPLRGRHASGDMANLLSGLAKCPLCGSTMTRLTKGGGTYQSLVCTKAKVGAGCDYVGVRYQAVEDALLKEHEHILRDMPHADQHLAGALRQVQVSLDAAESKAEEIANLLERHPSETVAKRLATHEAHVRELRDERDALAGRAAATERKAIALRVKNLGVAIRAKPLDRRRINAALRELLTSVTIDYTTGHLEFAWRAGGTSSVLYSWPKVASG